MNNKKLPSILAVSICLELILSPLALAQNNDAMILNTVNQTLNLGMNVYNNFRTNPTAGNMPAHVSNDMQSLQKQQTPAADKHFTIQNMQKIPGLMEYIAKKNVDAAKSGGKAINPMSLNCTTLPTTLYETNTEVCRNQKINTMAGDPKAQAEEAFLYYNQYLQVGKVYENFSAKSNSGGQAFGTGCMEDAMEVLKGFFAYRVEQLGVISTKLESMIEGPGGFIERSEMDLTAIRESSAILNGDKSGFASEFKDSQIFDYGKRFEDPACNSLLSKDGMNELGGSGLLGIEKKLKADYNSPAPGSKYSPEQYIKNNADIVNDIKKMADKVAEQSDLNFGSFARSKDGYSAFLGSVGGDVSTDSGANVALNKGFFSDLQTKFAKTSNTLNSEAKLITSELGGGSGAVIEELGNINSDANFSAEITSLENGIKGACINNSGIDTALSRIYDPTLSRSANKHSSEQIKKRIKSFINDVTLSPAKKLEKLNELEASGGARYEMKMDADYKTTFVKTDGTTGTKDVNAAGKVTPGSYFTDLINNCESQFQVNKLNNKITGKEAIKKLWALKKDFQKAAKEHSKDIKNEIVKKMIDCNGNGAVANSSAVGSCTPEKLNMASAGFCTKAAFSCSTNMKKCTEKAQKFVKDIKDDRASRRDNYNNTVETTRKQMVGMFDSSLDKYMKEAESMRGMFGVGFTAPTDVQRDLKGGAQFMSEAPYAPADPGDKLDLKDPKAYLRMVKANIASLQTAVQAQQEAIMGNDGPLNKHIKQTEENYKTNVIAKAKKIEGDCLAAYNSYKTMLEANQKAANEKMAADKKAQDALGEKSVKFCNRYADITIGNPIPGCDDGYADVSDAMITAAAQAGNQYDKAEAQRMRAEMKAICGEPGNQRNKEGSSSTKWSDVCAMASLKKDPVALKALEEVKDFDASVVDGKAALVTAKAALVTAEADAKKLYYKKVKERDKAKAAKTDADKDFKDKKKLADEAIIETDKLYYRGKADEAEKVLKAATDKVATLDGDVETAQTDWDTAKINVSEYEPEPEPEPVPAATGGICEYLRSSACSAQSNATNPNTGVVTTTMVEKCGKFETQIVANYDVLKQVGGISPETTSGDAASFCNAGNNSGPYNTKNWMNPGGAGNNPMANGNQGTGY